MIKFPAWEHSKRTLKNRVRKHKIMAAPAVLIEARMQEIGISCRYSLYVYVYKCVCALACFDLAQVCEDVLNIILF